MPQQPQKASAKRRRNTLRLSGVAICRVGDVAAKEFICAFAAESYGHVLAAERGKKPNGERPGVGERFIGVVREFLNGRGQIQSRVDIKLVVFGVVSRGKRTIRVCSGESWRNRRRRSARFPTAHRKSSDREWKHATDYRAPPACLPGTSVFGVRSAAANTPPSRRLRLAIPTSVPEEVSQRRARACGGKEHSSARGNTADR